MIEYTCPNFIRDRSQEHSKEAGLLLRYFNDTNFLYPKENFLSAKNIHQTISHYLCLIKKRPYGQ